MPREDGSGTFPLPLVRAVQPSESETRLDGDGQILAMFDEYVTAHPMIDRASHLHASRYLSVRNLPRMAEQLLPVRQREAAIPGCREPHDSRSNVAVRILEVVSLREQWFVDRHEPPAQRKPPPGATRDRHGHSCPGGWRSAAPRYGQDRLSPLCRDLGGEIRRTAATDRAKFPSRPGARRFWFCVRRSRPCRSKRALPPDRGREPRRNVRSAGSRRRRRVRPDGRNHRERARW
jgi:hypothetical protein